MPVRPKTSTTRLPSSLLEQIQESDNSSTRRRSKKPPSRKESRKQLRAERKHRKAEFFSSTSLKRSATTEDGSPPKKKAKLSSGASSHPASLPEASTSEFEDQKKIRAAQKSTALAKSGSKRSNSVSLKAPAIRTQQERNEDAYIAYLEAKLGYTKNQKSKQFDDGLDDLFDFANFLEKPFTNDEDNFNSLDHDEDDTKGEIEDDEGLWDENEGLGGEVEYQQQDKGFDAEVENEIEEWHGIGEIDSGSEAVEKNASTVPQAFATRYVPPQLREKVERKDSEEQVKLMRQIKGSLNRMSEQNIASILDNMEEIYRNHRRHDVTSTTTTLIIDSISSHSTLLDSYVVLYAAFVSSLHKIVGVEFAAYFVQNVVLSYEQHLASFSSQDKDESTDKAGKEASNLVVLLSELYNFQVVSCVLIFDIIRTLLGYEIQEYHVELLLKIVRNSGQQLRNDDPLALKDIVQTVQSKLDRQEGSLTSRTRFMLETLHNVKMNQIRHLGTQTQGRDAVERMKKFLGSLNKKRHVLAHEPLRITLDDLHYAEKKGKWWLVGAAWGGDPLIDRQKGNQQAAVPNSTRSEVITVNDALLKLAKKHGMNTDIRRSIFVVLMSSDDYVDACDRLSQLKLTEVQQREIVRVVLHCCGNEKVYNPYYALVCQHLCSIAHSYKITLQYCLWDFFRELGETNVGGAEVIKGLQKGGRGDDSDIKSISLTRIKNIAKTYAWWTARDSVTLAVLRPLDFTVLKPQTQLFLRHFFTYLFLSSQSKSPLMGASASSSWNRAAIEEIIIKVGRIQTLAVGLVFFLSNGLAIEEFEDIDQGTIELVKWGIKIAKDILRNELDIPNL